MESPLVVTRSAPRAPSATPAEVPTALLSETTIPLEGRDHAIARAQLFLSQHKHDRGGFVLRLIVRSDESSFIPAARDIKEGIEISLAGEAQAAAMIHAIRCALAAVPPPAPAS